MVEGQFELFQRIFGRVSRIVVTLNDPPGTKVKYHADIVVTGNLKVVS